MVRENWRYLLKTSLRSEVIEITKKRVHTKRRKQTYNIKTIAISCLRRAFARSPTIYEALDRQLSKMKGPRNGRQYICEVCGKVCGRGKVDIHHKDQVIPLGKSSWDMSLDEICSRIDVPASELMVLCLPCHDAITKEDNKERSRLRKLAKFEFDPVMYYILENGTLRHGVGVDSLRKEEIKYIAKSYKTALGANKYLSKVFPDK